MNTNLTKEQETKVKKVYSVLEDIFPFGLILLPDPRSGYLFYGWGHPIETLGLIEQAKYIELLDLQVKKWNKENPNESRKTD